MILAPTPIGVKKLERGVLEQDKKACRKFGPCGLGKEALYLGGRFIERRYYICWKDVRRVFKRVAMSKGGFSGKGLFGSIAFLVVLDNKGQESQCQFKREEDIDRLLEWVEREHPKIPTHSAKAEKKLAAAAAAEEARYRKELSPEAENALSQLRRAKSYLEQRPSLSRELTASAKQKRVADNFKLSYRILGVALLALGVALVLYGVYGLTQHLKYALYFLAGGGVLFLFTLSTNTLPSRWNSKKYAQQEWEKAVAASAKNLEGWGNFPVPPQYAHPDVLERMIRAIREGRAQTTEEAYECVKADLRALNASVTVSQKEYDEVVAIKPMFLVCEYQDQIERG